jgi:glucose-1-phosphate adenylyltransferase
MYVAALFCWFIFFFMALRRYGRLPPWAPTPGTSHDFGRNVIPDAIEHRKVVAYPFQDVKTRAQQYWRDVGTVDAYYEANMELVQVHPELNIYDERWPIWTYQGQRPPAKFVLDDDGRRGMALNSMVSGGCIISGATINQSLLFSNVRVDEGSLLESAVVLPDVRIGRHCTVRRAILDESCVVPDGFRIGVDRAEDARRFHVTDKGIVLVTRGMMRKLRRSAR